MSEPELDLRTPLPDAAHDALRRAVLAALADLEMTRAELAQLKGRVGKLEPPGPPTASK